MKRFYRSLDDRFIVGICGGISKMTNIDPLIWRLIFIGLIFTPFPIILFYIITGIITESIHWKD
jgi:phage shock protein C